MSAEAIAETMNPVPEAAEWELHKPPTDLIFDDGEPLESNRHRIAMNALIDAVPALLPDRTDYFMGGNMFIYYSSKQAKNRDFRGPDFFAVLDVEPGDRLGWVVWEEEGRYPDVIVELTSPSTRKIDLGPKKDLYERVFRTRDYFVYDPFNPNSLQGWHLDANHKYQPLEPDERGWLWCETLGAWLGNWEGTLTQVSITWLRFYHPDGTLAFLPNEAAQQQAESAKQEAESAQQQAELAQSKADRLAAKLREMGVDPDQL
jgi:Uma2 family endonuclease